MTANKEKEYKLVDRSFNLALIAKAAFAIVEVLSGLTMIFITPVRLQGWIDSFTDAHLTSSTGFVATHLTTFGQHFTVSSQWLTVIYLLSHGLIKLIIIYFLWKRVKRAYPLSIVLLFLFIIYQMYEFFMRHSVMLLLASLVDLIVIGLTIVEYRRMRGKG